MRGRARHRLVQTIGGTADGVGDEHPHPSPPPVDFAAPGTYICDDYVFGPRSPHGICEHMQVAPGNYHGHVMGVIAPYGCECPLLLPSFLPPQYRAVPADAVVLAGN